MTATIRLLLCALPLACCGTAGAASAPPTMASVLAEAPASDWEPIAAENLLQLEVGKRRVLIELAPQFAPRHADNIRTLAKAGYFDGLAIVRVQENYVVQWGDPNADSEQARSLGDAASKLPAEFARSASDLPFTGLADPDAYAARTGFSGGFPVALDQSGKQAWLVHCYGMVGAGRGDTVDSSTGAELYTVIGHSPRHLDRNITLVGRVIEGMDALTVLPRGNGPLGFYQQAAERVAVDRIQLVSAMAESERPKRERLRSDSTSFARLIEARRNRRESWFVDPVGHVEVCNVPIPVREASAAAHAGD